jgi:hypothetical protein
LFTQHVHMLRRMSSTEVEFENDTQKHKQW